MQEFDDLIKFSKYINVPLPLNEDFHVMRIEDYYNTFSQKAVPAFRHKFYAVSLYEEIETDLAIGFWKLNPDAPFLMFKSPYQVVSWSIQPGNLKGWFIMFTERFVSKHKQLAHIIQDLPFLQLDKSIPFEIGEKDTVWLSATYQKILEEYHSNIPDRYELIASYVQTLLLQVRRLYEQQSLAETNLTETVMQHDIALITRFRALLNDHITEAEEHDKRSVMYYARQLFIHPNHLNAVAKRITGNTAIHLIHEQIINAAKTLLLQTGLSVKELAYQLAFSEPTHFVTFFKKNTGLTPLQFREQKAMDVSLPNNGINVLI